MRQKAVSDKKNQFLGILWNDIIIGGKKNIVVYIIAFLFAGVTCFYLEKMLQGYRSSGKINTLPQLLDYLVYLFGGMKDYVEDSKNVFEVPVIWMAVQLFGAYSVCFYPVKDLNGRGTTVLIQYGSRSYWWFSKCVWSVLQIGILYIALFLGVIAASTILENTQLVYHAQIGMLLAGTDIVNPDKIINMILIMPFLYSMMMALVQIFISLLLGPAFSLMIVVAYHVLSAYITSPILLGNGSMLFRLKILTGNGMDYVTESTLCIGIAVICVIAGVIYFKKYDILNR